MPPMDHDARARLAKLRDEKRAATRGRTCLKNYDPVGWSACLDRVHDFPEYWPEVTLTTDRRIVWDIPWNIRLADSATTTVPVAIPCRRATARTAYYLYSDRPNKTYDMPDGPQCPWAELRYATSAQRDQLEIAFGARRVMVKRYGRQVTQPDYEIRVFPARPIVTLLTLLWPADAIHDDDTAEIKAKKIHDLHVQIAQVGKYVCGMTESYLEKYAVPGDPKEAAERYIQQVLKESDADGHCPYEPPDDLPF